MKKNKYNTGDEVVIVTYYPNTRWSSIFKQGEIVILHSPADGDLWYICDKSIGAFEIDFRHVTKLDKALK